MKKENMVPVASIQLEVLLLVNNIFRTCLDLVKQDADILPQYTDRQQLDAAEENDGGHDGGPARFSIAEAVYLA